MKKLILISILVASLAATANAGFTFVSTNSWDGPDKYLYRESDNSGILRGIYDAALIRIDDSADQLWYETDGGATAVAKYAGHNHRLGYSKDNGASVTWLGPDPFLEGSSSGIFHTSGSSFVWVLEDKNTGDRWYSDPSLNVDLQDHMVTYEVLPLDPTYVICWEDLRGLGDQDYQDLVVELSECVPIPAPGAILLGSIGVGLVGWLRRRRIL